MAERGSTIVTHPNARTETATRSDEASIVERRDDQPDQGGGDDRRQRQRHQLGHGAEVRTRNHSHGIAAANTHIALFASDPT